MSQMKEFYEKVANDRALQAKFNEILKVAQEAGEEATGQKLLAFAKESGYEISLEEMQKYFQNVSQPKNSELSDLELDMVAGGKSTVGWLMLAGSIVFLGMTCAAHSLLAAVSEKSCGELYQ